MVTVNLRKLYPWYKEDVEIEVSDDVAQVLLASQRSEWAHQRKLARHKAQYSLDCDDGIEARVLNPQTPSPQELLEKAERFFLLWNALNALPEIQGRRIDACIIIGRSFRAQARLENVSKEAVRLSVQSGLETMRRKLKDEW